MLKIDTAYPGGAYVEAQGDIVSIVADLGTILSSIHSQFKRHEPQVAELFQYLVKGLVTDPETPVWNDQSGSQGILIVKPKNKEET